MDPERVHALPQPEITSPVHALGEYTSGTSTQANPFNPSYPNVPRPIARIDDGNLGLFAGNASSLSNGSERVKSEVNETSSLHHRDPRNNTNVGTHWQPSVHFESIFGRKETKINNNNRFRKFWNMITRRVEHNENHSGFDWRENAGRYSAGERLQFTVEIAVAEKARFAMKAKWAGLALNTAIGLQVLLGSLTTGLSALAVSGGRSTAAATTALGAIATLVASFLARARGSGEPESSSARAKALDQFIRRCKAFQIDHGHIAGNEMDEKVKEFRQQFEEILGNTNGEPTKTASSA